MTLRLFDQTRSGLVISPITAPLRWVCLASVLDLFSQKGVGYAISNKIDSALAINALQMAYYTRCPLSGLLHHSDQGQQFICVIYMQVVAEMGYQVSKN
jgi:putative transposase